MRLRYYKNNDTIKTKKWAYPFTVKCVYKGYIISASKANSRTNYLIIDIHNKRAFMGSARYEKYGLINEEACKDFLDRVIKNEIQLAYENSCPINMILEEGEFLR